MLWQMSSSLWIQVHYSVNIPVWGFLVRLNINDIELNEYLYTTISFVKFQTHLLWILVIYAVVWAMIDIISVIKLNTT